MSEARKRPLLFIKDIMDSTETIEEYCGNMNLPAVLALEKAHEQHEHQTVD
jgi:hypothetical protein